MSRRPSARPRSDSLFLKLGGWFEARATGWGVLAVPAVLALLLAAGVARALGS